MYRSQGMLKTFLKTKCNACSAPREIGSVKKNTWTRAFSVAFAGTGRVSYKQRSHFPIRGIQDGQSRRWYAGLPDHIPVTLPALSPTMLTGTIARWERKEGDELKDGDLLAEIQTDKAAIGFETPVEGFLAKIILPAGTKDIAVGTLVCIIVSKKEDVEAFKNFKG